MKKVFTASFLLSSALFLFLITPSTSAKADTLEISPMEETVKTLDTAIDLSTTIDYDNLQITEPDGSTLNFDNIDDMKTYVETFMKPQKDKEDNVQPYVYGETIIGTEYKYYVFMGYSKYTKDWGKPNAYTTLSGESQTFSHKVATKWGDVTASYSRSEGVNRTIPADPSRWSRLAGYADLKIVRTKVTQPSFGTLYFTKATKLNSYIAVKYK
ncbi:MAG: hypothetical protein H9W82_12215 [Lactobacillus sp.]|nr:hypothetical protein [Lactobacillus sp.]